MINARNEAAIIPPKTGDITQLAAIAAIVFQLTSWNPTAAIPAPITPPTTEWVVETGAPTIVAKFTQIAAAKSAAIIAFIKILLSGTSFGSIIPLEIVETTSPPANNAPALSKTAAISSAANILMAFEPTAGPTLLATSLAPIFKAI